MLLVNNDSNTGQLIVSTLNIDNVVSMCSEGETSDHGETSPFKINGRFIRMHQICINGSEIDQPTTPEGKQYLLNAVSGNEPLSLEINSLHVYTYDPSNFEAVKKALSEAKRAL